SFTSPPMFASASSLLSGVNSRQVVPSLDSPSSASTAPVLGSRISITPSPTRLLLEHASLPSALNARAATSLRWIPHLASSSPVWPCHNLTSALRWPEGSKSPVAKHPPVGLNARQVLGLSWPRTRG